VELRRFASIAALLFAVGGCAATTQTLFVTPDLHVRAGGSARGATLALRVEDQRAAAPRAANEPEIQVDPDVASVVRAAVARGFEQQGFLVVEDGGDRELVIEIVEAGLRTETGTGTMLLDARAAFHVLAKNGKRARENTYRAQSSKRTVTLPNSTVNEQQLDDAVNRALQQLFDDGALMALLAR
jgi:uncharacterized lipoprotein YajG